MVYVDIVDYSGEWFLDLVLLDLSYVEWFEQVLLWIFDCVEVVEYFVQVVEMDGVFVFEEFKVQVLVVGFMVYLKVVWDVGYYDCMSGWFLLSGDFVGFLVLIFVFLFLVEKVLCCVLWCEMECWFEVYKFKVVKFFFCDYFVWIDWQVVLVDVLGVINCGFQVVEEMCCVMVDILVSFCPG